jgi:hypothetical protein
MAGVYVFPLLSFTEKIVAVESFHPIATTFRLPPVWASE